MQHSNQPVQRADYQHRTRYTVSWPVHRPTIFFLEIVERAFENKNREGFIDRWRKGVGLRKEKIYGRSFFFFPALTLVPALRAHSRDLVLLACLSIFEKKKKRRLRTA